MTKPSDSSILALADYAHEWAEKHVDFGQFDVEIQIRMYYTEEHRQENTVDVVFSTTSFDKVLMAAALTDQAEIHHTFAVWRDLQLLVQHRPDSQIARDYARNFGPDASADDWRAGFTRLSAYVDDQLQKFPLPEAIQ